KCEIKFQVCLFNARSVRNKSQELNQYVCDNNLDIFAITETWLSANADTASITDLVPNGYSIFHQPRPTRGGGVALIFKSSLGVTVQKPIKFTTFEYLHTIISVMNERLSVIVIYRPPSRDAETVSNFFSEFPSVLDKLACSGNRLLLLGDFNFHLQDLTDTNAVRFNDLLRAYSLCQHVSVPTHNRGNILDLVISRDCENLIHNVSVSNNLISDHFPVNFNLSIRKPPLQTKTLTFRNFKKLDKGCFINELQNANYFSISQLEDVNEKASAYNSIIVDVLDQILPLKSKTITIRPNNAWFTDELLELKKSKTKAEKTWYKTKLHVHKEIFKSKKNELNYKIKECKKSYFSNSIENSKNKQRELFKISKSLLDHTHGQTILPESDNQFELACKFSNYFSEKIQRIRSELKPTLLAGGENHNCDSQIPPTLCRFQTVSENDIKKLVKESSKTTCSLDPIPSKFIVDNLNVFSPVITDIINSAISENCVPDVFKHAIVFPLIKKPSLDINLERNYRPVSNLSFISKLLERCISKQLVSHI
ncbi:uncharacterized protein LOC130012904, partial [Patella vulgata]|uniref:uncharacterized protein LOC130012904 n=1 Tax=Patella vulgata TaxID=6465 RepID=UPI0024A7B454